MEKQEFREFKIHEYQDTFSLGAMRPLTGTHFNSNKTNQIKS